MVVGPTLVKDPTSPPTTCACHLVIIISEESLFVDAVKIIGRPDGSISLVYYLILWRNNYYTCFPESRSGICHIWI